MHSLVVFAFVIWMICLILITIRWWVLITLFFIFKWFTHACFSKICHLTHCVLNSFLFRIIITFCHKDVNILERLFNSFLLLFLDHLFSLFLPIFFVLWFLFFIVVYFLFRLLLFFIVYQFSSRSSSPSRFKYLFLDFFRLRFCLFFRKIFLRFLDWFWFFNWLWCWFRFFETFKIDDN
jgi:hypothetical protein